MPDEVIFSSKSTEIQYFTVLDNFLSNGLSSVITRDIYVSSEVVTALCVNANYSLLIFTRDIEVRPLKK